VRRLRVAVTGASGFIGGAICAAAVAAGWEVHGYGRSECSLAGVDYRRWDLVTGPLPAPPPVDVMVHAGALVSDWAPRRAAHLSNVDGTRHVVETFPGARLVHISSASVYDPRVPAVRAIESAALADRYPTGYAASKAAAERFLTGRPDTVILRPHAVYGPGDRTLLPRVLSAIRGGALWIVGPGTDLHSLTSIDNLVSATLLACRSTVTGVYNVADAEPVVLRDALREMLDERGLRVGIRSLPIGPARVLARGAEWALRAVRSGRPPRLTRYAIDQIAVEHTLDLTAARMDLGFEPAPTSFAGAANW
jgi:nucleoside-diphosphate-sugar epimerase